MFPRWPLTWVCESCIFILKELQSDSLSGVPSQVLQYWFLLRSSIWATELCQEYSKSALLHNGFVRVFTVGRWSFKCRHVRLWNRWTAEWNRSGLHFFTEMHVAWKQWCCWVLKCFSENTLLFCQLLWTLSRLTVFYFFKKTDHSRREGCRKFCEPEASQNHWWSHSRKVGIWIAWVSPK